MYEVFFDGVDQMLACYLVVLPEAVTDMPVWHAPLAFISVSKDIGIVTWCYVILTAVQHVPWLRRKALPYLIFHLTLAELQLHRDQ